ncbi:hypothetical protein HK098_004993 [Nowakowskiella sp. JEL0407]|nr:hypothetical protein HK098_004993 [Nowakowskiella sp. JEL0407]
MPAPSLFLRPYSSVARIAPSQLKSLLNPDSFWWKSPYLNAWIHKSDTAFPLGIIELARSVFGLPVREDILYRALRYEDSWREQGTESTLALGQVRGSTRKPFPQKGRGKARVGTLRAPMFRGGYTVHGPKPHDKSIDIQQKLYNLAIKTALSAKFAQDQLLIIESFDSITTADKLELKKFLKNFDLSGKKLCLLYGDEEPHRMLVRAADKISHKKGRWTEKRVLVANAREIAVSPLMDTEILVLDKAAVEVLEEMYAQDIDVDPDELFIKPEKQYSPPPPVAE